MQETSPASNSSRGKRYKLKMPFFGQIVVIKRNGTDGNHFPLTANSCLFGRKKECDIRIQLPQVSKEHCKIEVNENKEAMLFNLSSVNPTQLNGNHFQDPTHLKHGDILTIIDRSFRFEYPPPSVPQKRLSRSQEKETLQILHVQHMQQMNMLDPQNSDYKSSPITEAKKSPQKRRGTELDFLVQSLGKRKRVSFGGQLSPELFDKRLPPNSPLKRGAIPARLSMPFGNSPRAVLKKAAELRQSVTQGSFERMQYENTVSEQADLDSVSQRQQCVSDPQVASQSSEGGETTTQEMHMNSLFSEVKKTVSDTTSSLRRSKPCTPRRHSIRGKSGVMGIIQSKRRSGASEANLMVTKSWAEVVKQGVPKLQPKSASKQGFKTRPMKKVASKSSEKNSSLKTPKRKISGHFTTGHANSPAPIVIGKAHTRILNITAQVPKVVNNYPLKKHCDFNESFTGLAEMFCSPPDGKQKSFVPESQIPEINASEEFEKKSVLDVTISSQKIAHNQDVISPALEEVSQIPIHDNLTVSLNERNIMGMEEEKLQQESEPVRQLLEIKSLLKTTKERSEPVAVLPGDERLLRIPKEKSEPNEALSGVKRLLRTPKEKSESVEALSGVKSLLRTPKQKSEPVEVLSAVKRLLKTPKQKSEPVEALSGVKRVFKSPKEKSEPVEDLSGVKRLFKTPEQKSEPVEDLSGVKGLFKTPEQKSEPVEVFSGIKMLLKTPEQTMEPLAGDIYTKSRLSTEEVLKDMIGSVTKTETQIMEDTNINGITEEVKETVKPIEGRGNIQMLSPKQRFEPINNMVGSSMTLKASKPKSVPTDDYLRLQKFMIEPKESFIIPNTDDTGVKEMLDTENDKAKVPESLNFVEESEFYTSSRNKLESMESVPGSCETNLEIKIEKESHFPVTKNNSSIPNHVGHVVCNSFNELKTELNKNTTRTISLSQICEPEGMSFKNEAKAEFEKEAFENSDALKIEKPEPLALARTRRKKTNGCSFAVYTKIIQRPTKNRSTSANCEQISENFDSHTELNPLHKSENNFTTIETTKLSRRGRPKKQHVETNGNLGSDNISHTQELEKPVKEIAVEKPVNRKKVPTKRKGKTVASMDLEENGPMQENESDLTAKTRLRCRNVKQSASDVKATIAKGKANDTVSGEENNKRNTRRKIVAIQPSPETLMTNLNGDKRGTQKCRISKICKTSENNLTTKGKKIVEKEKKVHFLLKDDFKASEEKCAFGYESNTHKEEESQTENICNGISKVPLESMEIPAEPSLPRIEKLSKKNLPSRGRGKKSVSNPSAKSESKVVSDKKDHDVIVSLNENQPKRGRGRKKDQVLLKSIPLENNTSGDSTVNKCPSSQSGCSLPQVQNEHFEESEMLPLENVQNCEGHILPKRIVKDNPPRRGRSKQVNETSGNKEADVQGPNMAIGQEDNQSKRARRKRNTQEPSSLKSQRTVKENPLKRGRHKKTVSGDISTDSDSTHITSIIDENKDGKNACLAKEDQSKVRRTRNTVVFQEILSSVKNDTCHLLSSNRGEHSDEQPNENLNAANNANQNSTYKCRKRKAVHEISANSVSSSKKSEVTDDIQQNGKKDSKALSKQNTSRSKRKRLTSCGTSAESNDELRINSKMNPLVTDNVGPLENSFEKKRQSKKQREETNTASLVSPSLKVSITLSSANENQSGNCKESVGKRKLAKLSGTYNIMTRSLRGKCIIPKEEFVHEIQNKDLQKTAMATMIHQRRGRRNINKLEGAVSPSLKEEHALSADSDNFPNQQILNNVSNTKVSLMVKAPELLEIKTMTQNISQNDLSNYDQNRSVKHSNMLVQKSSSGCAKRKQNNNSETIITANKAKDVIPESKSTVSKTVQTRGKKKMKEENTTLMTELPEETKGITRARKRIRK